MNVVVVFCKCNHNLSSNILNNNSVCGYYIYIHIGGARGVVIIVVGNGHGDTCSNPRRDWLHFT